MASSQKGYCRMCGKETEWGSGVNAVSDLGVCGKDCCRELRWREALSVSGVEYYPNPAEAEPFQAKSVIGRLAEAVAWLEHGVPSSCGNCGSPNASCDCECVNAAQFAEWLQATKNMFALDCT